LYLFEGTTKDEGCDTTGGMTQAPPITFFSVSLEAWLTIAAILTGPSAALLIQKYLENRRAKQDRKVNIFRTLMTYRASRLSAPYVQALNGIETEFYGDIEVIEAWRSLVNHLYTPQGNNEVTSTRWNDHVSELVTDLLYQMAESLGYHFDKVTLQRNVYYPSGWNQVETEQTKLRQAAVKVFEGEETLKVEITNEPAANTEAQVAANPVPPSLPR
jgi:hypothetical protein